MNQKQTLLMLAYINLGSWSQKMMERSLTEEEFRRVLFGTLSDMIRAMGWEDQEQFWTDNEAELKRIYGEDDEG